MSKGMRVEYFALKIFAKFKGCEVSNTAICIYLIEEMPQEGYAFNLNKEEIPVFINYLLENGYITTAYDVQNIFVFKFYKRKKKVK
jgi:hypothetical protein